MPALFPVDNTLGAMFIGAVLSSITYGVTWLQVYSYYDIHCSRDRWPLKFFVAFLMLVNSVNAALVSYATYQLAVTDFGDYRPLSFLPWSLPAIFLSATVIEVSVQHFYAYRIYLLSRGSPYLPAAISIISLVAFGIGMVFGTTASAVILHLFLLSFMSLVHSREQGNSSQHFAFFVATLSCNILCDVLITFGMIYTLWRNRTHFRRTNNVLNLLAIYAINYGTLNLVLAVSSLALFVVYQHALIYIPPSFLMVQICPCAFMAILNSRNSLRETLDGRGDVVTMLTQLEAHTNPTASCGVQLTTEARTNAVIPKSLPLVKVSSDSSILDHVIAFNRQMYPVPTGIPGELTV